MADDENKELSSSIFFGKSLTDILFGKYPTDIKPGDKKSGRMRKALRRSLVFRHQRRYSCRVLRVAFSGLFADKLNLKRSLHQRRKESRGFVSNRKSGDEGDRVEWETLSDTKDK